MSSKTAFTPTGKLVIDRVVAPGMGVGMKRESLGWSRLEGWDPIAIGMRRWLTSLPVYTRWAMEVPRPEAITTVRVVGRVS